jgi:hypothetical protein
MSLTARKDLVRESGDVGWFLRVIKSVRTQVRVVSGIGAVAKAATESH